MNSNRLLETEIKASIINFLLINNLISFDTLLLNEYSIDRHSRRVDLLAIIKNTSIAFEIKSEADSLRRIDGQIEKYLNFFDKLIIVAAPKHINEILRTSPKNVAIWQISSQGISIVQTGQIRRISNKFNLLKLMTVRELTILANQTISTSGYKHRNELENILKDVPLRLLRASYFANIAAKYSKPNHNFWEKVKQHNCATVQDISLLSLYQTQRNTLKQKSANKLMTLEKLLKNSIDDSALLEASTKSKAPIFGQIPNDIKSMLYA